jgi:antitoxin component of MazEF toxin-antitoxin module
MYADTQIGGSLEMALVKVRRVGNSTVITLPAWLKWHGFDPGSTVIVEAEHDGTLRVIPVPDVATHVREVAQAAIQRRQRALDMLEEHDRRGPERVTPD